MKTAEDRAAAAVVVGNTKDQETKVRGEAQLKELEKVIDKALASGNRSVDYNQDLSAAAKEALRPVLELLNVGLDKTFRLGHIVSDAK